MMSQPVTGIIFVLILVGLPIQLCAQTSDPGDAVAAEKLFEERVRPVLAEHCFQCHGQKTQESGLRLDSRALILRGGDSGTPAAKPGEPQESLLIQAVQHRGELEMPPDGRLSDEQIQALTHWIQLGMPWPSAAEPVAGDTPDWRAHWSFQPVRAPPPTAVKDAAWIQVPLDRFVLARLEAAGIAPSVPADRRTLIRRVTFDLHGLPPTPEEVVAFVNDARPDAYERLVDRLLASPLYGERWGRHWLDIARYADTRGYAFGRERRYPYAYTYRDYVIESLNADLPYDRFILEQLAADRLPDLADHRSLAALGFLTVGRKFSNIHDDIDDQIDAICRGLLGLTVGCARCHDHKYDPIPTEDYYSLYGVLASCSQPEELPLIASPDETDGYRGFEEKLQKLKENLEQFKRERRSELVETARRHVTDYLVRAVTRDRNELLEKLPFLSLSGDDLRPKLIQRWRQYLVEHTRHDHPVFGPLFDLSKTGKEDFSREAPAIISTWCQTPSGVNPGQLNPLVKAALSDQMPQSLLDVARIYGQLLTDAYTSWLAAGADADQQLTPELWQLSEILLGSGTPTDILADEIIDYLNRADRNRYRELQKQIESHQVTSPGAPARAMVLVDKPQPFEPRVFIRGNQARPGKSVPRQFLAVLSRGERKPFTEGSGRSELARAIASPANPLTRRVIVNRLWMHHFGRPLVATPSDFGTRCEPPVHADLLDHLATQLAESGWSLKAIHREMLLSNTYRQSSNTRTDGESLDPENRLWWRMNRRRLEFEALRDSLFAVSGQLDTRIGGRPVELFMAASGNRRAVYGFVDRQDLPNLLRIFDFASPDQSTAERPRTTVPQQALFLMNSPLIIGRAKALADRLPEGDEPAARITALYRQVLGRSPSEEEMATAVRFLEAATAAAGSDQSSLTPWQQYAQLLLLTNEFLFID